MSPLPTKTAVPATPYPIVFFDALRVKIRDEGLVKNKEAVQAASTVVPFPSVQPPTPQPAPLLRPPPPDILDAPR